MSEAPSATLLWGLIALAVFLASDESSFMVGKVISPNGGQVI